MVRRTVGAGVRWAVVASCCAVVAAGVAAAADKQTAAAVRLDAMARYLDGLPDVDRVEVYVLGRRTLRKPQVDAGAGDPPVPMVAFPLRPWREVALVRQYRALTGEDAKRLAALWRGTRFEPKLARNCHKPAHGLRFFSGTELVLETSVSWDCRNFSLPDMGRHVWMGLDADGPTGVALLRELLKVLPPEPGY